MPAEVLPPSVTARLAALLRVGVPYRIAIELAWRPKVDPTDARIPGSDLGTLADGGKRIFTRSTDPSTDNSVTLTVGDLWIH